jgi:hypothetical protein
MSNFLAIATVSATLSRILNDAVSTDVPGSTVTTARPDSGAGGAPVTGVNLFLYQVMANAAGRNADLPTRRDDGTVVQRPRAALDLHYLLSFTGRENELEPQRLLGSVARTLHAQPVLSRQNIQSTKAAVGFLAASDLDGDIELVRFTPLSLSLEDLSKLWSVFFQVPYALSVAYQASVLFIEGEETPQSALPVRLRNVYAIPFRRPYIDQLVAASGEDQPIVAGSTVNIVGKQLQGDVTLALIGGIEVIPAQVSDTKINLVLPASLRAGVQGAQIKQQLMISTPPSAHRGFESNVAAFVLAPTITILNATATKVSIKFNPKVGKKQRVVLLLNEFNPPANRAARANRFDAPNRDTPAEPDETDTLDFVISGVVSGKYIVRVQVDGAESSLDVDTNPLSPTFNQYTGTPQVTIP